jgi:hypothetical protein
MELILIRNYPGMRHICKIRRVTYRGGRPGFTLFGLWWEIAEALYSVDIKSLLRIGRAPIPLSERG